VEKHGLDLHVFLWLAEAAYLRGSMYAGISRLLLLLLLACDWAVDPYQGTSPAARASRRVNNSGRPLRPAGGASVRGHGVRGGPATALSFGRRNTLAPLPATPAGRCRARPGPPRGQDMSTANVCAALAGAAGGPCSCSVYPARPWACQAFEVGGPQCREARWAAGLAV
jgi:hypothetical protein